MTIDINIKPNTLTEESIPSASVPNLAQSQAQIKDMQMEIDILKKTINALKNKYSLPALLKRLTDITEFALPSGKVYLSALVDCFDGVLPGWTIGTIPYSALVNMMLDQAIAQLPAGEHPIIHSDRRCHYRWSGWIIVWKHHLEI